MKQFLLIDSLLTAQSQRAKVVMCLLATQFFWSGGEWCNISVLEACANIHQKVQYCLQSNMADNVC
jgi:hypothetical protein